MKKKYLRNQTFQIHSYILIRNALIKPELFTATLKNRLTYIVAITCTLPLSRTKVNM